MHTYKVLVFLILCVFYGGFAWAQPGQLSIQRVDMMPAQPTPYNMRNWEQVAQRYDSLVYDVTRSGQYLPLSFLSPAGINYPEYPAFRLHTYVGTNAPFGNEAINVLPSLVGASLVGIDKRSQYGYDWIRMAQDFYNKNNGEHIYLNSPSTSSGNDWWYDMMPNVFFYQLYDLYPGLGTVADSQFVSVANRMLASVQAMGGNDAPWAVPYMNYRAWNFRTMTPNPNGVPEPEAAGAYAWLLYNAWKVTGNPAYLKGADWSMEFLNNWQSNPSYELQLPYGTLTAARMNAELGTRYDIAKLLNWSFDRGALRGWGTIVGNWGGFDVSGLVGEANDNGNDYAFQLNGMQQAAALVPMVRYDKRYARAIAKWVLNLANASRLFFPGFLPAQQQDASAWSAVNDPRQVMGYEAMRQQWQGLTPFATGDAVNGGWAATNLALYGTSSVGYLGAMVKRTNVDRILQIDLLKTDFFGDTAYPTYLYYNSFSGVRTVQLSVGDVPVDIYETLSESFIQQDVTGTVQLSIPPNQAVMVVLCPANGSVSYEDNRMLVDGIVVDYGQTTVAYNRPPRLKSLAAATSVLQVGQQLQVYATAEDSEQDPLSYSWEVVGGSLQGEGAVTVFQAPTTPGSAVVRCIVTDTQGQSDTASLQLTVVAEINVAPQLLSIEKSTPYAAPAESVQISCDAVDANGDQLTFSWSASGGSFSGSGSSVVWTAPASQGIYSITVTVADEQGLSAAGSTTLWVRTFSQPAGNLVAHYPFSGNAQDVSGNQLHGQANGAILTTDAWGNPQRAYYFNGGSQHIAVANHPLLNHQAAISVSAWFRANALPDRETFLLSHGSWQNRWKLSVTQDRKLRWTVNTLGGIGDLDGPERLETDTFYHLTATYDGSYLALYFNGELHAYKALSGLMRTTTLPLLMGQMLPSDASYNFKGVIDEVKLYNYAMPPAEVMERYLGEISADAAPAATENRSWQLLPNPAATYLLLDAPAWGGRLLSYRITDLGGRLVQTGVIAGGEEVDISLCMPGVYFLSIQTDAGWQTARFVKI